MNRLAVRAAFAIGIALLVGLGTMGLLSVIAPTAMPAGSPSHASTAVRPTGAAGAPAVADTTTAGVARALAVEKGLEAKGISPTRIHLPNFPGAVTDRDRQITPSYTDAPAPMGVADIGLANNGGTLVPYELNTTSVAGTLNVTNLQSLYVDGDGPDTYGVQLNSVAVNVTVFGNDTYQFWSQNYVDYTPSTDQLVFGDEVWNFSSLTAGFPASTIYQYSPNGSSIYLPFLYQGYGPAITIAYPFSLTLYLNTTVIGDRPAFFFNYTVSNATFSQSASFDYLIFNSTVGVPSTPAVTPVYQADGYDYDPIGLINDMEIDLLGNDDGDVTAFYSANATLSLQYWNITAGAMETVPSAYNAGEETGETSVGLMVFSSGGPSPVGIVRTGPSFVGGLWNYTGATGAVPYTIELQPANAFLFATPGIAINLHTAQWIPTSPTGTTTVYLPSTGDTHLNFLLSDYEQTTRTETPLSARTVSVTLTANASVGIYTPLFSLDNAELANISSSGTGTASDPYVLESNQYGPIAPEFAQWDDYLFPVFPGLLVADSTAYIDATLPSFEINIPGFEATGYVAALNLPSTNDLGINLYNASHISIVDSPSISGWLSLFQYEYPESSIIAWDCSNLLIASNQFEDQGNALLLYGGSSNTVWGNTFVVGTIDTATASSIDDSGAAVTGINESESGDLIYNNFFDLPIPATTPTVDPFECGQYGFCYYVGYADAWNVSRQPATDQYVVLGQILTGSIIGTSYQGGSYWSNYGTGANPLGVLPYNDSGQIAVGGDYVPLVPTSPYLATFTESGLPAGSPWSVTINGNLSGSTGPAIYAYLPSGTYSLTVGGPAGFIAVAPSEFTVNGGPASIGVTFAVPAALHVNAKGLPADAQWSTTITGAGTENVPETQTGNASSMTFEVAPGTYQLTFSAGAYTPTPSSASPDVGASGATVNVTFLPPTGGLHIVVLPTTAQLWVAGGAVPLTQGVANVTLPIGVVSIEATASGYQTYFNNVTVTAAQTLVVSIFLTSTPTSGLSPAYEWGLIGLGILVVVLLVVLLVVARRPRQGAPTLPPPAPAAPAAAPVAEWQETPPDK